MNLLMYIDFVAPLILSRKLGIDIDEASELVKNNLSDETLNALSDDEKEYLGLKGADENN